MTLVLPGGIGASSGDPLVTSPNVRMAGVPYYVSSVLGSDANSGLSRQDPMATLGAAYTAAAGADWIVLAADHDETLTGALALNKALTIVGEGSSSGAPTAKLRNNQASSSMLVVGAQHMEIANVLFPTQVQACSSPLIVCNAGNTLVRGCRFEMDGNYDAAALGTTASAVALAVESTTFISTAVRQTLATSNDPPETAMELDTFPLLDMKGVVFDGGEIGWSDYALKASVGAITAMRAREMSFLRGADYSIHANTVGYIQVGAASGDAAGSW